MRRTLDSVFCRFEPLASALLGELGDFESFLGQDFAFEELSAALAVAFGELEIGASTVALMSGAFELGLHRQDFRLGLGATAGPGTGPIEAYLS